MLTIKIRDREFKIDLVTNFCHMLYEDLNAAARKLSGAASNLSEAFEEYKKHMENVSGEELKNLTKEYRQTLDEFEEEKAELKAEILRLRWDFIKEVCKANGIDFDEKFWLHKTDTEDLNDFLVQCVNKDITAGKKTGKK